VKRKIVFTGTLAILGGIQRFSSSNKTFSHKLITHSDSAQNTGLNEVSFKVSLITLIFFHFFRYRRRTGIVENTSKNESCPTTLKDTKFNSVFCADSESVISL